MSDGGLFSTLDTSGSGLTADALRLNLIAGNIANADTPAQPGQQPFQRRLAVLQTTYDGEDGLPSGVEVSEIVADKSTPVKEYDPQNPEADAQGYVLYPNISTVSEMTDMIDATRAYESNVTAMDDTKQMITKSLDLFQ